MRRAEKEHVWQLFMAAALSGIGHHLTAEKTVAAQAAAVADYAVKEFEERFPEVPFPNLDEYLEPYKVEQATGRNPSTDQEGTNDTQIQSS